jgi:hypothetical protein
MLISVSSIVAPFLSSDGHTCSSRRFCTLIIRTEGVTLDKIEISSCPSLIALSGKSIFNDLVMFLNIAAEIGKL